MSWYSFILMTDIEAIHVYILCFEKSFINRMCFYMEEPEMTHCEIIIRCDTILESVYKAGTRLRWTENFTKSSRETWSWPVTVNNTPVFLLTQWLQRPLAANKIVFNYIQITFCFEELRSSLCHSLENSTKPQHSSFTSICGIPWDSTPIYVTLADFSFREIQICSSLKKDTVCSLHVKQTIQKTWSSKLLIHTRILQHSER